MADKAPDVVLETQREVANIHRALPGLRQMYGSLYLKVYVFCRRNGWV